jgi:hypothetical protein
LAAPGSGAANGVRVHDLRPHTRGLRPRPHTRGFGTVRGTHVGDTWVPRQPAAAVTTKVRRLNPALAGIRVQG